MHYSSHDRYRRLHSAPIAPRRSFVSRYRYWILLVVIAIITLAVVIPVVILRGPGRSSRNAGLNGHENDLSLWTDSFNINTDWDQSWPETGVTRTYCFTVTEVDNYIGPDGVTKQKAMLINGQFPGPVIQANWGDRIEVTVINELKANGTSIHWHGFRQYNNNVNDGASGVTECPIPPGHQKTYSFQATQYGTSWYHSHISSQYANGIVGAIQIDGPASYDYDIDLGTFPISDWYYNTADNLLSRVFDPANPFVAGLPGSPPPSDNILFNGTNVDPYGNGTGNYAKVSFCPGKRHRLRLINTSADNTFTVSIVGHPMTVIATDFVPVQPYPVQSVYMTVGQRYDVVIDANQPVGTYWLNVTFSKTGVCGSSNNPHPAAIVQYDGAPWWRPGYEGVAPEESYCADDLGPIPVVPKVAPGASFINGNVNLNQTNALNVTLAVNTSISKVFWTVNSHAINVDWNKPTLEYLLEGGGAAGFAPDSNVIEIPDKSQWSLWLIQNISPIPHPIHLHGHDFIILARSPAPTAPLDPSNHPIFFNPVADSYKLFPSQNPTPLRRDTTMLPGFGWLVVAFETNNPGAWLFHCHIVWHASQGLSVQFLERETELTGVKSAGILAQELKQTCPKWREYQSSNPWPKVDSGV